MASTLDGSKARARSFFSDRFVDASLELEYYSPKLVSAGEIWIEGERLRINSSARLRSAFGSALKPNDDRKSELDGQKAQGEGVVGIDRERLFAETVTRFRLLAEISGFLYGCLALEGQVLGVGICRRRPLETGGLDLGELIDTSRAPDG